MQVLTDEQWADLAPLIEDVRPKGKTPPRDLRRTIEALKRRFKLWRHDNGARWRALPSGLGPWHRAAQLFIRWAKPGVWQRLLDLVPQPGVGLGMVFMDGTTIGGGPIVRPEGRPSADGRGTRAHGKAAGAAKRGPLHEGETAVSVAPLRAAMAAAVAGLAP